METSTEDDDQAVWSDRMHGLMMDDTSFSVVLVGVRRELRTINIFDLDSSKGP